MAEPGLGKSATQGAIFLGLGQMTSLGCSIVSTIVLARLLTPEDFGLIAMLAPLLALVTVVQDLGLNQATVQSDGLTADHSSVLFWYNVLISVVLGLILVAAAPLIASFYGEERLIALCMISFAPIVTTALSAQHLALLSRARRFKAISIIQAANSVTTLAMAVTLAVILKSYWAILLGMLSGAFVALVLAWSFQKFRPTFRFSPKGMSNFFSFGANVAGANLLNYLVRNVDTILVGKYWGSGPVGMYDRSYKLMVAPMQTISRPMSQLMLPILARLEGERYRVAYLTALRAMTMASMPVLVAAAICSTEFVHILLGPQWGEAAPIFRWLSLAALFSPVSNATGWLFISTKRPHMMFRWTLIAAPIVILLFFIGVQFGAAEVALGFLVSQLLRVPILYHMSTKDTPVSAGDLYALLVPPAAAGLIALPLYWALSDYPEIVVVGLIIAVCYVLTFLFQFTSKSGRQVVADLWRLLRSHVIPGRASRLAGGEQ